MNKASQSTLTLVLVAAAVVFAVACGPRGNDAGNAGVASEVSVETISLKIEGMT